MGANGAPLDNALYEQGIAGHSFEDFRIRDTDGDFEASLGLGPTTVNSEGSCKENGGIDAGMRRENGVGFALGARLEVFPHLLRP